MEIMIEVALGVLVGLVAYHYLVANADTITVLFRKLTSGALSVLALLFVLGSQYYIWTKFGWDTFTTQSWQNAKGFVDYFSLGFAVLLMAGLPLLLGRYSVWLLGHDADKWEDERLVSLLVLGGIQMLVFVLVGDLGAAWSDYRFFFFWVAFNAAAIGWRLFNVRN